MNSLLSNQFWSYAIGYAIALVWGQLIIAPVLKTLYSKLGLPKGKPCDITHSAVLGIVEGALYVGALQLGRAEFIAVWLGLKTVIGWRHWETDVPFKASDGTLKWIFGRRVYNIFLLGNGLVIAFAAAGSKAIDFTSRADSAALTGLLVGLAIASFALIALVFVAMEHPPLDDDDPSVVRPRGAKTE